jgi:large subunit ribosomal protein L4
MKFSVYNLEGKKTKDIELSEKFFGLKPNDALVHQVYVSQYANRRQVLAHTKDRAERAGSGKKPWKQKGTGRARVGSVRTPVWRKGGITFGPTKDRNFKKDIPKKMKKKALLVVLSGKVKEEELILMESLKMKELKTKSIKRAIDNLKIRGTILFGFGKSEKESKRASRNIARTTNIDIENLNVFDILNHKYLIISEEGLKVLEKNIKTDKK